MIEKLGWKGCQIFTAELSEDKTQLRLTEACDGYFDVDLTKEEVIELANDFLKLAEQMNA